MKVVDANGLGRFWNNLKTFQPDWNQADESALNYIKNKPALLKGDTGPTGPPGVRGEPGPVGQPSGFVLKDYDPSKVYETGYACVVNGSIYRCLVDNTTGIWNSAKWEPLSAIPKSTGIATVENGFIDLSEDDLFQVDVDSNIAITLSGISSSIGQQKRIILKYLANNSVTLPVEFKWPGVNILQKDNPAPVGTVILIDVLPISNTHILITNYLVWDS